MVRNSIILLSSLFFINSCAQTRKLKNVTKEINNFKRFSDARMLQKNKIKTNGYYFAVKNWDINENTIFENKSIILLKFDRDGYCNIFHIAILKGKTFNETIISFKERSNNPSPFNSGVYNINGNKIIVKYSIFNNPKHLFGKYITLDYKGFVINENNIQLKVNQNNLKFKFIEDDTIGFKNYFRENKK